MDRTKRKRTLGLITFLIVVPLFVTFLDTTLGSYLLIGGLLLSSIISFSLARNARKMMFTDYEDSSPGPDRAGEIIWVSLEDEDGNPLPKAEAQRRLDEARSKAGPMDQVIAKPLKK